jgi:dCTP deaminase
MMKDATYPSLFPSTAAIEARRPGILASQEIRELIRHGKICAYEEIAETQIQPASIDLRLGRIAYRVEASFLPSSSSTIGAKINALQLDQIDLSSPATLSRGHVFIIPLVESLALPPDMSGKANPKSTIGRLDIFTRLMTDGGAEFEQVPHGYRGNLYVEVVPRTFPIVVQAGTKLNQLRFWRGSPQRDDEYLRNLDRRQNLVYFDNGDGSENPLEDESARIVSVPATIGGGLRLTVDLQGHDKLSVVAYKAKKKTSAIDLSKVGAYNPLEYWECIVSPKLKRIVLQPGDFYLLGSRERISVPPEHAAEMEQYDPSLGEFSVHYAGFFDPGFGYGLAGEIRGTRAVLEVRAHEVPILLEHGQTVGRVNYYRMTTTPEKIYGHNIGSSYQEQGLALSKQFRANPGADTTPDQRTAAAHAT